MSNDLGLDHSDLEIDDALPGAAEEAILLAQVDTGPGPGPGSSSSEQPSGDGPGISVMAPDPEARVYLPGTASLEEIRLDGNDLLLIQPDGSQIRITGGALTVPTFVIGDIEVPQDVLIAALAANGFDVAAGPGGALSLSPQAPAGSGGELEPSADATLFGDVLGFLGLLADSAEAEDQNFEEEADVPAAPDATIAPIRTNDAPVVSGAVTGAAVEDGASVSLLALANASDVDAGTILTVVDLPATLPAGVSYDAATQRFTLDPSVSAYQSLAAGASTTVTVAYAVSDGLATTPASASWTVTGTNDAPIVSGAVTGVAVEDGALVSLDALANASDVDAGAILTVVDLPATLPAGVSYDAATQRFTLDPSVSAYQSLAAGATTTVSVAYGVSDGLATTPASVSWTVTGTNDAPMVSGVVTGATVEDGASVSLSALANASDVDAGAIFTVVNLPTTLPAGVSYDAATQRFTLDPSAAAYQSLAAGAVTTVTVAYGVSDGAATTPASVSWTVTGTNDAPVVSGAVTGLADEDGAAVSLDALANASDVDAGAILTVVDLPATLPAGVSYDAATQRFTLDPSVAAYQSLVAGATTTVTVAYGVSDGLATTPASVSWTVTGTNDAPVVSGAVTGVAIEDGALVSLDALANASDVDAGAILTVVDLLATLPAGVSYDAATQRFTLDPSVSAYQSLAAGATTTVSVAYGVSDGLATTPASVSWTVTGTNDAPMVSGVVTGATVEDGASVSLSALANASDVDAGAVLTVVNLPATLPAGVTYDPATQRFTLDPSVAAYQSLAAGATTTVTVAYGVSDGLATTPASVSWTVTGANDAPVVSGAVTGSAVEDGASVSLDALANASDVDAGAILTVVDLPATLPAGVSYDPAAQRFTLDPSVAAYQSLVAGATTTVTVAYGVSDGLATTPASVSWTVTGTNDAPVVTGPVTGAAVEDGALVSLSALAKASDVDAGAILTVVDLPATLPATLPAGVSYDAATQRFTLDPAHAAYQSLAAGVTTTVTVTYGVSDGLATTPASVSWTVIGTNDAPMVSGTVTGAADEDGVSVSLDALANASDVDAGAVLSVVDLPATLPAGVSYDAATQRFTLDPSVAAYQSLAAGASTTVTVAYAVSDGLATTPASVSWTVTGTNDAPIVSGAVTGVAVEDGALVSLDALANASDIDAGAVLSVVNLPATLPAGVSYDAATQRFTLDPSAAAYQSLAAGATTTVTVTYGVSDGLSTTPALVSWTVTGTNDAPVISGAAGQNVAENAAGALVGTFTVTDVDTASGLTFRVLDGATVDARFTVAAASGTTFGQPGNYEIRLAPGRSLDFEAENADGDPTITRTLEVSDGQAANSLASASFTLTVTDVPEGALAVDDAGATLEDEAVSFTVAQLIANDDGQGRPLTITGVSGAVNGTVTLAGGIVTLTPAANFSGQASFTYTLDNGAATGTGTVTIDVAPVNDAPVVSGPVAGAAVEDGASVSLDALANASDVDAGAVLSVVDLPATLPAGVSYDAATQRFTLDPSAAAYQSLAAGATTTVTVAYGVSDGAATTPASVSWTVTGTNDAPVVSGAVTGLADEDGAAVSLDALANASDVDAGAILAVVDLPATLPSGVSYDPATQRFTLDPAHAAYQSLAAGAVTTVTVAYGVSDGAATTPASVSWTVTGTNDAPVVSGAVTGLADEDGAAVSLDALANASDVDAGAILTVVDLPATLPAGVSYDAATMRFTLDPSAAAYQSLAAGVSTTVTVAYGVSDGLATTPASVSWTVTGTNDAPVISGGAGQNVAENAAGALVGTFTVTDVDTASGLTFRVLDGATVDARFVVVAASGTTFGQPGSYEIRLAPGQSLDFEAENADGNPTIVRTLEVSDGAGVNNLASAAFTLTVTDVPEGALAVDDAGATLEDTAVTFTVAQLIANDDGQGRPLTITGVSGAVNGTVTLAGGIVTFTPAANFSGQASFTYTLDNGTATGTGTVTIDVAPVNDAPVVSGPVAGAAVEDGASVSLDALAKASDVDAGAVLSVVDLPATLPAGVSFDAATQRFTLDPSAAAYQSLAAGATTTVTVAYGVSDGLATTPASVSWTVTGTNDAPVVSGVVTGVAIEDGASVSLAALANASDVDAGAILAVVNLPATLPAGVSFDAATQRFTLDPSAAAYQSLAAGVSTTVTVAYGVSDGLATTPASVSWTVTGANDVPVVSGAVTGVAIEDGASVSLDALANASDVDAGAVLSVVNLPATLPVGVSFDAATQRFTLDPSAAAYQSLAAGATTTVTVAYGVSDGLATTPASATWTVTGTNDAPVVSGLASGSVAENAAGALIDTFTVTDVDTASGLTFRVLDAVSAVDGRFVVVAASGTIQGQPGTYELRLKPGVSLDFEAENADSNPTIGLRVEVNDHGAANTLALVPVTVTVTDVVEGPVATDDSGATSEDTAITFTVAQLTGNDSNPAGAPPLTIAAVSNAMNGTVTLAGGIVTFTPEANFSGIASFDYTLDNGAGTDTGTVTIDVAPVAAPAVLSLPVAVAAAPVQVTGVTTAEAPAVAALSGGGHVVVWYNANNLHYATYTAAGVPGASGVLSGGPYYDRGHSVVALDNNGFAIIGNTNDSRPASLHSFASPGGTATVTQIASGEFWNSAMTRLANGDIAFAIEYGNSDPDIRIGIITPGASAPSALVDALSNQAGDQEAPDLAALPGGGFVAAWSTAAAIQVQRYGADGTREGAVTTSLPVSDTILSFVPSIAVLGDGSFVVAFYSSGANREVYQLRYGVDGQPLGEPAGMPVRVNTTTTGDQTQAEVVALPDGGYVIVWLSSNPAARGIYGQRFDADGVPLGAEFQVADGSATLRPSFVDGAATLTSDGDLLVAYQSSTNSGTISYARVEIASLGSEDAGPISLPVSVTIEPGDTIQTITVTGVPSGAILSDGVRSATSTGASIDLAGWTLSTLAFAPPANASGTFTLTLSVTTTDTATLSSGSVTDTATVTRSFDVTVIAVNDAPALTGLNGVTFRENTVNAAPQIIDADVAFADIDSANLDTGKLTVSGFIAGQDTIGIRNQGAGANQIGVSGANVTYGGVVIGTVTGGSGANNLVVSFNANATPVAVDALIQNLTYANSSNTPTAARTLTITVTDGDGGTVSATSLVTVTAENDAPTLTGDLSATVGQGASYVLGASDLGFSDVDDGAADVVFSVSSLVNGTVWVAGSQANSFTGVQLAGGSVEFRHNGSATTSASFHVSVEDGNEDGSAAVAQAFSITVTPPPQAAVADHLSFAAEYWQVWETNGHAYYTAIPNVGQTPFAHVDTLLGGAAYVVTITSAGENAFILANARHNFYSVIGASDSAVEGVWRWIEGPESGTQFWSGNLSGTAVGGAYAGWASGEPNNGGAGEDYVILVSEAGANYGKWVDVGVRTGEDGRYIAEAGAPGSLYVANQASGQTSFLANILLQNDTGSAVFSSVSATSTLGASLAYNAATGRITYNAGSVHVVQALTAGQTLDDTFTYQLSNGSTGTVRMTITGVNDAPTLTGLDGVTFLENTVNAAPQVIDANVVFADVDSANLDTGTLTVSGFINGQDTIGIRNQGTGAGQIGVSGGNISFGGTVIGTAFGGSGPNNLIVIFNANATPTAVDALIQNLTYANSSNTPTAARTLTITVTDGDGGTVSATSVVNVTAESDVPLAAASNDTISPVPSGWTWLATNGHIYKFVNTDSSWTVAQSSAANEISGSSYLATITSADENNLIDALVGSGLRSYLGANDATTEGTWTWVTGPEAGTTFWIGGSGGNAVNGAFIDWGAGQPSVTDATGDEDYLATDLSGNWNDIVHDNTTPGFNVGYTAEAGGLNGQTYAAITEDAPFTFSQSWLLANDANAPAAIQSVSATSSKGAAVGYNSSTGEITYNPTGSSTLQALRTGQTTTDTFTYTISDGNGGTSTATVTVNVQGISTAPVVSNLKVTATSVGFTVADADSDSLSIVGVLAAEILGTSFGIGQHTVTVPVGTTSGTVPVTFGDGVGGSFTPFSLGRGSDNADNLRGNTLPTGAAIFGFGGSDFITGSGMNDYIIGGAGGDLITGGLGSDRFIYAAGDTAYELASFGGNSGSVSGFDTIYDFDPGVDRFDFAAAPQVATVNGPIVDGADSFLRYVNGTGNEVGAHRILSGGIIQFSASASLFSPLTLNSGQAVAAAVDYLGRNDLGAAGTLVSFSATLGGVNYTYVYQQVGDTPNAANDILIELVGVSGLSNLATVLAAAMDPIVLDLNGDGLHFTGASFDLDHDGVADSIAWPSGGDGLLVVDLDGSGAIESGNEVFSPDFNGGGFATSLEALASLDSNGDGRFDTNDAQFRDVRIWIDANGDGVSDAVELVGLADAGVAAIRLDAQATSYSVHGQRVFAEGVFERTDGSTGYFFGLDLGPFIATADRMISGGAGDDILIGGPGRDTLTGGPGADRFVFDAAALADAGVGILDLIADYNFGEGDIIDLSALLGAKAVNPGNVSAYVRVSDDDLEIDIDGAGGTAGFVEIAEFSIVPAADMLRILVSEDPSATLVV